MIGAVLAVAACAAAIAAGAARADDNTGWCGYAGGTCDSSQTYVQCSDGTVWVLDQSWSVASFGETFCGGDYTVLQPPAFTQLSSDQGGGDPGGDDGGNTLSLATNMAPDPLAYVTEIQCSDGLIWAVASGDAFVCPAA